MNRYWMTKDDSVVRIDLLNKDADEYKYLTNNGWKIKREELICTESEMYQFLDKNGPSDIEAIKAAFPKYDEDDLKQALGVLVYTAKTVDTMNGIKGMTGVFVTAKHQKNWAGKIQRHRSDNNPLSVCDLPNPDVDKISTCDNKPKIIDITTTKSESNDTNDEQPKAETSASIKLTKIVQKELRKDIVSKATKENLFNFNEFIATLSPEHKCYWNEYLDNFKQKLILTEIKKKTSPG